nr:integrase, catalytic region, zinc finger, CCHC-type, peptidase aspartic, catalytic [Tanacetum cinerariifolium]
KSKSAKKPVNRKVWKTTGKVFKTVGYKWTPTGRTFTLVGNVCPLTRIATAPIVPPREPIPIVQSTDKPVVTLVYTRKPRAKNVVQIVLKVFTNIGYKWRPTGRTFTIVGNACPLTRITTTAKVLIRKPIPLESNTSKHVVTLVYSRKPNESRNNVPVSKSKINKSLSADKKEPNKSRGSIISNVPSSSTVECRLSILFSGTVKFGNDHVAKIMGYGDYKIGNVTISKVYFVEGLGHNLFSVGQFCDSDLEVAFRQHTCFICNLKGVDLLTGT